MRQSCLRREAYAIIGVGTTVSMEEAASPDFIGAKIKYAHPDGTQDLGERKVREGRTKRLNLAYGAIEKRAKHGC